MATSSGGDGQSGDDDGGSTGPLTWTAPARVVQPHFIEGRAAPWVHETSTGAPALSVGDVGVAADGEGAGVGHGVRLGADQPGRETSEEVGEVEAPSRRIGRVLAVGP